jgi:hypothetical protein
MRTDYILSFWNKALILVSISSPPLKWWARYSFPSKNSVIKLSINQLKNILLV